MAPPKQKSDKKIRFLDTNVLEEAKARIRHCYINYDHVWLSFSGGKDSLCVLRLMRDVLDEMGMQDTKVNAFFRDEEVIPEDVIQFVQDYCQDPRYNIAYFAVPMKSHVFMMGEHWPYTQWDTTREWMRQPPPYAITQLHPDNKPLDQHEMNGLTCSVLGLKGRICIMNGIRADESITRFRSCIIKRGKFNWVAGSPGGERNIDFCKPIFDWATHDLFKYFQERGITYPSIYDMQMYSGESLRVATPLHDRAYQSLIKLRVTYPKFYEQILSIWPEVATQERYWGDVDRYGAIDRFPKSWDGIVQYVEECIDNPANRVAALKGIKLARAMKDKNRRMGRYPTGECYGFPLLWVFRQVVGGGYMKGITSQPFPTPNELAYEEAARDEALRDNAF